MATATTTTMTTSSDPIDVHSSFDRHIEIIATFFTARYYNEIYNLAQDMFAKKGGRSLTETYASTLCEYLRSLERPDGDGVIPTIHALHEYSDKYCGHTTLNEFIARIISQIAPEEYYTTIGARDRDAILRGLVSQVALAIGKRALEPDMMRMIIDNRSNHAGVSILRNIGARVLRDFKASFLSKLYGDKVARHDSVVSSEIYNKMRNEFRAVLTELVGTQIDEMRAKNELAQRVREIEMLRAHITNLERQLVAANAAIASAAAAKAVAAMASVSATASASACRAQTMVTPPKLKPEPEREVHETEPVIRAQPIAIIPEPKPNPVGPKTKPEPETEPITCTIEPVVCALSSSLAESGESSPMVDDDAYYESPDERDTSEEDIARAIAEANKARVKAD